VPVVGNVYVFMGVVVSAWPYAADFNNYGGGPWGFDNYRLLNYLSDFAENWSKVVYVCQNDTCEIISQSNHPFNSYDHAKIEMFHICPSLDEAQ